MAGSRCRVPFTDSADVFRGVDVDADSLYEAVAAAVVQFREDDIKSLSLGPMTEITAAYPNPVEHKILLGQGEKWAEYGGRPG